VVLGESRRSSTSSSKRTEIGEDRLVSGVAEGIPCGISCGIPSVILGDLRRSGRLYQTLCPFHHEKEPSFTVYPDDFGGHYHCFSCNAHGTLRSLGYVLDGGRLLPASCAPLPPPPPPPRPEAPARAGPGVLEALTEGACVYHSYLRESPEALAYLQQTRGLFQETLEAYLVGYADGKPLLAGFPQAERQASRQRFFQAGLLTQGGADYFRGCLTFPDFSLEDDCQVSDILGRGFPEKMHRRLPSEKVRRRSLYLERFALRDRGTLIIVEGPIDALTLRQAGFNAVGLPGVHAFNHSDAARIKKYGFKNILVALDGDQAGAQGSLRVSSLLAGSSRILPFPQGHVKSDGSPVKDWNELFVGVFGGDLSAFRGYVGKVLADLERGVSYVHTRHLNEDFKIAHEAPKEDNHAENAGFTPQGGSQVFGSSDSQSSVVTDIKRCLSGTPSAKTDGCAVLRMLSAGNEWSKETLPVEYVSPSSAWLSSILSPAEASVFEHLYNWFDGKKKTKLYLSALFSWGERKGREAVIEKVKRCGIWWVKEKHREKEEERFRNIACGERQFCPRDSNYYFSTLYLHTREVVLAIVDSLVSLGVLFASGFKAVSYEITLTREISEYLDALARENLAAWDERISDLKKYVLKFLKSIDCKPTGFCRFHYLSSSMPWLVHYHFHVLVIPAYKKEGLWRRIRRFLDPGDLEKTHEIWAKLVRKWAAKWEIPCLVPEKLDLKRRYFKELARLYFYIKYSLRPPLHDFIKGLVEKKDGRYLYRAKDPEGKKIEKWLGQEEIDAIFDRVALYHSSESYKGKKNRNFRLLSWFGALSPNQKKKLLPDFDLEECDEESPWERADDYGYMITGWNSSRRTVTMRVVYRDLGMGVKMHYEDGDTIEVPVENLVWDKPLGVVKVKKIWRRKASDRPADA
jgi:hypothetical protein